MKKVEAVFRPEKLDQVIDGLMQIGYPGLTISEVKGHGKQRGITQQWRGNEYVIKFIPKIKIELVILDEDLNKTVDVIIRNCRTGSIGDGKIFVIDVDDAFRVRTGDSGFKAI